MILLDKKIYSAAPKQEKQYPDSENNRDKRQKIYSSSRWKKLRLYYLYSNPVCEHCGRQGAEHVHHRKSFLQNGNVSNDLAFDEDNLQQVCEQCHIQIHNPNKTLNLEGINKLLGI